MAHSLNTMTYGTQSTRDKDLTLLL